MKRVITIFALIILTLQAQCSNLKPISGTVKLPPKYTDEYLATISEKYKKISDEQIIHVAIDMMQGTSGEFSKKAILGYNLSQNPIKVEFKNLAEVNKSYETFDAVGWKKKGKLYIFINPKHSDAPPEALAALLAHEALHQDEYNSLSEETYAWTMEATVWCELLKRNPDVADSTAALVKRENILKQLLEKGNYSNKYIKKTVYSNSGYKNLPLTSPGYSNY